MSPPDGPSADPPWYEEWFDTEAYELVYKGRDESDAEPLVDLVEALADPAPGVRILDVACGRGRHARILARRGYDVTGFDLSRRALEVARVRAEEEGLDIAFERGDMREPIAQSAFDGAVNLFTSFGYFETDEEHEQALRQIARALKPNGWFVQDYLNPPHARETLIRQDRRSENGLEIEQHRWIEDGRLEKEIRLNRDGRSKTFLESVRLFGREDFERMYREAGLELIETRGSYEGDPYRERTSPRLILYARTR